MVWLQEQTLHLNSLFLMVILIWAQVGFSMVLLSAAVKGVPDETLEAARIDGANERQIFFRVVVPQIWPTVITVFITVLIGVMKVFDIVYVMTNGNFNTNVIALDFYNQLFTNGNAGYASAIVVMLMIAVAAGDDLPGPPVPCSRRQRDDQHQPGPPPTPVETSPANRRSPQAGGKVPSATRPAGPTGSSRAR